MKKYRYVGEVLQRGDALEKVHGRVRFADDVHPPGTLYAALHTSPHAYAEIKSIDVSEAKKAPGVRCVVHGEDFPFLLGVYLGDKPPLARKVVRHHGEPVAAVVADTEAQAQEAAALIKVSYQPIDPIRDPRRAIQPDAPVLHPDMAEYSRIPDILPEPGSNIANRTKMRKGDIEKGFAEAEVTAEIECEFPPGDHVAMEPRVSIAEINPDGNVVIRSSTQAPFVVRELLNVALGVPNGKVKVIAPRIGGGFGGKAGLQLEALAYLLSREVGGRPVRVANTREQDLLSSPGRVGLFAKVKLGAKRDGTLTAADLLFLYDSGAYADYAVHISRAGGFSCTGPYRIPNVKSDSLCVYTNHPFATAFRGFGHIEMTYAIERAMERLAEELGMDPLELRLKNAIRTGDTSPGNVVFDRNTGDLASCLKKVAERLEWEKGTREQLSPTKVRAKGISAFWKAPSIPTFASSAAILIFNEDGSVNLSTGIVEVGQGTYTGLKQIVAERLKIDPDLVHVATEVQTDTSPHDWETAASRSLFMAGRAAIEAVDDAVAQVKRVASAPLRCPPDDLEVAGGRVFLRDNPDVGLPLSEVVIHYMYPDGTAIGGPIVGRGRYVARGLTGIDPETGEGRPWLEYTIGSQGVEVEVDLTDGSYRILKAACCMDAGTVVNPQLARGQIVGGMAMSIGYAMSEGFVFDDRERVVNNSLRDFKIMRYGDQPQYFVDFLETPQGDGPYGARGIGEQGVLGIPGALSAALSRAVGRPLNRLPLTFEEVWKASQGGAA